MLSHLFAFRGCGDTDDLCAIGHVEHNACHSADNGAGPNFEMIADADLARHDDVIAGRNAAGDSDACADHIPLANLAVVRDHDVIVDLCALANSRRVVSAAVDRRARANFNVVFNDDVAVLTREHMDSRRRFVPEPVGSDRRIRVNNAVRANFAILVDHDVGKEDGSGTDMNAVEQNDARVQDDSV